MGQPRNRGDGLDRDRAPGFLVAGGGYLAFAHLGDSYYDLREPRIHGPELTTRLLRLAYSKLHPGDPADIPPSNQGGFFSVPSDEPEALASEPIDSFQGSLTLVTGSGQQVISDDKIRAFMRIGHSACAILFGWLGGQFTLFVYRRSRPQPAS